MTDYIPITEGETDPSAPLTSSLAKRWRDNPIAIAEGAPGAPKVQGIALGGVIRPGVGFNATAAGWDDLDRVKAVRIPFFLNNDNSATRNFYIQFTSNNGASWSGDQTLISNVPTGSNWLGELVADLETGDAYLIVNRVDTNGLSALSLNPGANCNGLRLRTSNSTMMGSALMQILGGRA